MHISHFPLKFFTKYKKRIAKTAQAFRKVCFLCCAIVFGPHPIICGVGDPFLQRDVRYHCPIYSIFNFAKPKQKSYT